jgi:CubicO group peptidase (beta-lactamase class C family)
MKRLLTLALAALLCIQPCAAFALTGEELDQQADRIFGLSRTVGGTLVVALGGEIVYERYYGYRDKANLIPVTEDTYFRIASVTKMVSGIGLLQLVEQGRAALDEDIGTYFGYEIQNTYYPDVPVTLRQLMSHTSTLSIAGGFGSEKPLYEMLSAEVRRRANYTDNAPGSVYEYSNFGAGVAGAVLEAVTGMSVNRYMQENVFGPLEIDAAYDASALQDPEQITNLYHADGSLYRSVPNLLKETYDDRADPENHYRTTVGSLWIRADDLAILAMALCGTGEMNGVQLLTEDSLAAMRADQAALETSVTGDSPYGLFLQRETTLVDGQVFYGHQGLLSGVLCNVYFDPETQFCFVLLTNGCNNVLQNHVGVLARRMFAFAYENFAADAGSAP